MRKLKIILQTLLIFGIVLSVSSCSDKSKEKLIDKQNKEITTLKTEISDLKNKKEQLESNKKLVANFYQELFGDLRFESINKYIGDVYIQHNPTVADGKQALFDALKVWLKGSKPHKVDIQRIIAEGNLVFVHVKSNEGGRNVSVMDVFRIENNKIVEHWDVMQEVPVRSANNHPMF